MAGSYRHILNDDGSFCGVEHLDNLGDAYEALEECYDMIQYLTGGDAAPIAQAWAFGHLQAERDRFPYVSHTYEELERMAADYARDLDAMKSRRGEQEEE